MMTERNKSGARGTKKGGAGREKVDIEGCEYWMQNVKCDPRAAAACTLLFDAPAVPASGHARCLRRRKPMPPVPAPSSKKHR